jgi:hypothetical protein
MLKQWEAETMKDEVAGTLMAEGTGLEPASPCGRRFSRSHRGLEPHLTSTRLPTGNDLANAKTASADTYRLYLKGSHFWNKKTPEGHKKSIGSFNQAIEADPNYALAFDGLADVYISFSRWIVMR